MMQKAFRYSLLVATTFLLNSCSKDYMCECTIQDSPTSMSAPETNTISLEGYTKDDAVDACESRERFTVDTVNINCKLL